MDAPSEVAMLKFDRLLIDPSPGELEEALAEACEAANRRCRTRLLTGKPADWRKFARDCLKEPEGWRRFRAGRGGAPASQVLGAWWADHIGRKHVRVTGRRVETHDHYLLDADTLGGRPPLWHVYPDHLYLRRTGGATEFVAACGCGVVGPPAALGWMGPCCGPCHDERADRGVSRLPGERPVLLPGHGDGMRRVAFSADGKRVAAAGWDGSVHVWDAAVGDKVLTADKSDDSFLPLRVRFSPDGKAVLVATYHALYVHGIEPLPTGEEGRLVREPLDFTFSPDGARIVWLTGESLTSAQYPQMNQQREIRYPFGGHLSLAVSPDGRFEVVAAQDMCVVFNLSIGQHVGTFAIPGGQSLRRAEAFSAYLGPHLAFAPDGRLFVAAVNEWSRYDTDRYELGGRHRHTGAIDAIAFAPDGSRLYVAGRDRWVYACPPDRPAEGVSLGWHLGPAYDLAVSPDGHWLATAGAEGVKLWPVRVLLGGGG
jgi:WD40 repeat protein